MPTGLMAAFVGFQTFCIILLFVCFFLQRRNDQVFQKRTQWIRDNRFDLWEKYSYDQMLLHFWKSTDSFK